MILVRQIEMVSSQIVALDTPLRKENTANDMGRRLDGAMAVVRQAQIHPDSIPGSRSCSAGTEMPRGAPSTSMALPDNRLGAQCIAEFEA